MILNIKVLNFVENDNVIKTKMIMKENEYFKIFNKEYNAKLDTTLDDMEHAATHHPRYINETGIQPNQNKLKGAEAEYGNFNYKLKGFIRKNNYYRYFDYYK